MGYFKGAELSSSERFIYIYSGLPLAELERQIDGAMVSAGYKNKGNGIYEYGSRTARLLLGAFHKYFKNQISIELVSPTDIRVEVRKATSGMSGGLIGMNQVKTEMVRLNRLFQSI